MTGRRPSFGPSLGLVALLTALAVPASAAPFLGLSAAPTTVSPRAQDDDLRELFNEGVALMRENRNEEALAKFQEILARDPSQEAAYDLWQSTDEAVWLEMLVKQGQFELVFKHLSGLVSAERMERRNDPEAIRDLLSGLAGANAVERARAIQTLGSQHGEYAVPYMLAALADRSNDDRRVVTIQALSRFGPDVVPPLLEALESPDAYLRRNVAATLGYIGDQRAAGMLLHIVASDEDEAARGAADKALAQMGVARDRSAAEVLVQEGRDYLARRDNVLSPALWGAVVWQMEGGRLVPREVPRLIFAEEMAKQSFYRALAADAAHAPALAGIARATTAAEARVLDAAAAGVDVEAETELVASGALAALAAGPVALDAALASSIAEGDTAAARALVRLLGQSGVSMTPALRAALHVDDASVAEEAALALTQVGLARREPVGVAVVARLARAAGREVLQGALVIDANVQRAETLVAALRGRGMVVNHATTGAAGLGTLFRAPAMDAIFLAETLPDLTSAQVLTQIERNPAQSAAPRIVLAADPDAAGEMFGDRVAGAMGPDLDMAVLDDALAEGLSADRALADDLAGRAAKALFDLARAGVDVGAARENLLGTLARRPDEIVKPALAVLAGIAQPSDAPAMVAVLADAGRDESVRIAAGNALAGLFARHSAAPSAETLATLSDLLRSAESLPLRRSVAGALGQLDLNPGMRAALVRDVRLVVGAQ